MARSITPIKNTNTKLRNYIINGNMDFWQRGITNGTSSGTRYLADRWRMTSATSTYSNDRIAFTTGQTDVPDEPTYHNQIAVTSVAGAGNYAILATSLEDVRALAGKTVTLTLWAKSSVARNIAIEFAQNFGTGGSPSSDVLIAPVTKALTSSWQKIVLTVTLPPIAGKTIGTTVNTSFTLINIWLDAGSTFNSRTNSLGQQGSANYNFTSVSLVEGSSSPAKFIPASDSIAGEIALCQRYYEKSYDTDTTPGSIVGAGNQGQRVISANADGSLIWLTRKRATPSVVFYSPATGAANNVRNNNAAADVAASGGGSQTGCDFNIGGNATNQQIRFHYTADADF